MSSPSLTKKSIGLLGAAVCVTLALSALLGTGVGAAVLVNGAALLAILADFIMAPGKKRFTLLRELPSSFEQTQEALVSLELRCADRRLKRLLVADTAPATFLGEGRDTFACDCSEGVARCRYAVTPLERGVFSFGRCHLESEGPLGLCRKRFAIKGEQQVQVMPNLGPMRHYRLLAAKNQLSREDSALHRIRGNGTDFVGLREYSRDDDWRKINWKATARSTARLITNVYDVEKNREVIVAVDTGRWMQAAMGEVTRLDRALELAAAIAQVALSSGDRVGLALYDVEVTSYIPPGKGAAHMRRMLGALYAAQARPAQSSCAALSDTLRRRLSKRVFLCLITYLDNPAEAIQAAEELTPLRRRHKVYVASLADTGLEALIDQTSHKPASVYLKASAAYRKMAVAEAANILRKHSIGANAAEPSELLTRSVRHYLSLRRMNQ